MVQQVKDPTHIVTVAAWVTAVAWVENFHILWAWQKKKKGVITKTIRRYPKVWKLSNTFVNNIWAKVKSQHKLEKFLNYIIIIMTWHIETHVAKVVFREKCISLNIYIWGVPFVAQR